MIIIFDAGISTGTTSVIANILGEKNILKAKKYSAQAISFGFFVSIIRVILISICFSPCVIIVHFVMFYQASHPVCYQNQIVRLLCIE